MGLNKTDAPGDLERKAEAYRLAQEQLERARTDLVQSTRQAYSVGMRKADILRAINHVWSREWLDRSLDGVTRSADPDR